MLTLREYQSRIIRAAQQSLVNNRHTGIYACQAAGKSVLAAFMAESAYYKGMRVLILSHRIEILKQNFSKMDALNLNVQLLCAGQPFPSDSAIVAAMSQTVSARIRNPKMNAKYTKWLGGFDFIIVDEAHRSEHDALFQYFRPNAWVIGMSGTWLRYGNQTQLSNFYSNIVAPVMPSEIINLGYVLPSENWLFDAPTLDDVPVDYGAGDYNQTQLQKKYAKAERYSGIIENYQRICPGKKALVFTTGARHCVELTKSFCDAGIKAKYLLSVATDKDDFETYSGRRAEVLGWLKDGGIQMVVSVEVLSTGFDEPSIECVMLDYSTKSYTKYAQSVGRGGRPHQGQDKFYVLDFGDNVKRFGKFEADPTISLFHKTGEGGVPPSKMCPTDKADHNGQSGCGRLIPVSVMKCPFCGYEWLTDKQVYQVELQKMVEDVDEDSMSIKEWAAMKKLAGWSTDRILAAVMTKNKDNMKKAFLEAIPALRTEKGEMISPQYYHFVKKHILKK
jgi:superfamily II DNA or RNA helicase